LSRWNEVNLEARLCRALDIARKTINYFAIDGYTDRESPVYSFGPEKPVAETAMLIYAASAAGHRPAIASRVEELARLLVPHARSERVLVDIALHPALAFKFAVPHILLTRLGYADARFDVFLRSCINSQAIHGHDRPPAASLERRWISYLWTGQDPDAGWRANLRDSVLNRPIDILGGLRDDAYAFTHLLMYCTDFGFQPRRLRGRRPVILGEADCLLARYMDAEDYDLAGEVLLAWPLTGAAWSPSAAFGFRVLASVEDQAGVLPCGNINQTRMTRLEGEERVRYALGTAYHTAYVMGFLCATSLRSGRVPPTKIAGPQCGNSCLSRLMRYVDDDQGHWQSEFSSLAETEQRSLTPFILNIAIVQKCRKRDYRAVNEILSLACETCIASSPMCRQAAELLERIANCSAAISLRASAATGDGEPATPAVTVDSQDQGW
jgi:hypothetical protein